MKVHYDGYLPLQLNFRSRSSMAKVLGCRQNIEHTFLISDECGWEILVQGHQSLIIWRGVSNHWKFFCSNLPLQMSWLIFCWCSSEKYVDCYHQCSFFCDYLPWIPAKYYYFFPSTKFKAWDRSIWWICHL